MKKCPACGKPYATTDVVCEQCSELRLRLIDVSKEAEARIASTVGDHLAKRPGVLWSIAWKTAIVVFGPLGVLLGTSLWDIWKYGRKVEEIARQETTNAQQRIVQIETQIRTNIESRFEEKHIRSLIENVASANAERLLKSEINPVVEAFKTNVDSKVYAIERSLNESQAAVKSLQTLAAFQKLSLAAQLDDRKAFDRLYALSREEDYEFKKEAADTFVAIFEASYSNPIEYVVPWNEGVDPKKLDFAALKSAYFESRGSTKTATLHFIYLRNDIPLRDRLQFMIDVMRTNESKRVTAMAGFCYRAANNIQRANLDVDFYLNDWKTREKTFRKAEAK